MVPAYVKGKLSLAALIGFLLRHLHQVPRSPDVIPTARMSLCYTLQIALQVMSSGVLRCSLNKGSCRRSSNAVVLWRSQIDARCVCNQGPQMMSRPGPKSGTRSSKCSRSFKPEQYLLLVCEGGGPIRRVHGKRPT